jgi:hypothetical protein
MDDYIGRRVRKYFPYSSPPAWHEGTVEFCRVGGEGAPPVYALSLAAPTNDDRRLWGVLYDDGDEAEYVTTMLRTMLVAQPRNSGWPSAAAGLGAAAAGPGPSGQGGAGAAPRSAAPPARKGAWRARARLCARAARAVAAAVTALALAVLVPFAWRTRSHATPPARAVAKRAAGRAEPPAKKAKRAAPLRPPVRPCLRLFRPTLRSLSHPLTPCVSQAAAEPAEEDPFAEVVVDMSGAACADDALPPLLAGEIRVCGQTLTRPAAVARGRAGAAWRAAQAKLAREERRWAQVLTPIHPSDEGPILNALRDHLKLQRGAEALSALPPDPPPCALVERYTVPESDPRIGLRGQAGVRVKADGPALAQHTIVGAYRALTLTTEEYTQESYKFGVAPRVALPSAAAAAAGAAGAAPALAPLENELVIESFAGEYSYHNADVYAAREEANGGGGDASALAALASPALVTSAFGFGNVTCLINDDKGPNGGAEDDTDWRVHALFCSTL